MTETDTYFDGRPDDLFCAGAIIPSAMPKQSFRGTILGEIHRGIVDTVALLARAVAVAVILTLMIGMMNPTPGRSRESIQTIVGPTGDGAQTTLENV